MRQALLRDCELVEEAAPAVIGERHTRALACFVASESRLHRYLRDRIVARWDIDVHKPTQ